MPPPIPASVSSVAGFPGKKSFEAALFLSDCSARHGRVDEDVERECPFLLQVSISAQYGVIGFRARGVECWCGVRSPPAVRIAQNVGLARWCMRYQQQQQQQ